MIRMISGYTSVKSRLIGPNDGRVELPEDVEQRLVALGVAEYATDSPAAPAGSDFPENRGVNTSPAKAGAEAATEGVQAQNELGEINLPEGCIPLLPVEDGTELIMQSEPDESGEILPAVDISDMSFSLLKAVAEQMGIETKGMRSKAALISAIENAKPHDLKVME